MKTLLSILIFLISTNLYSAGSDFISPFKAGNKFYYKINDNGVIKYSYTEMVSDTIISGMIYLKILDHSSSGSVYTSYERLDTATLIWYKYYNNICVGEWPIIGFNFFPGQTWFQCMPSQVSDSLSFSGDTSNIIGDIGVFKMVKKIPTWRNPVRRIWTYCEKFGFVSYVYPNYRQWLVGAEIDGITYGVTGIESLSGVIPDKFSLFQNYPNPFNPATKIKFDIPGNAQVKLIVYDILGSEVAELVNNNLLAGTYEYTFDGSALSSGIYFYSLETEDFKDTKKMLLIK